MLVLLAAHSYVPLNLFLYHPVLYLTSTVLLKRLEFWVEV